jgi:diguanylate cyclase (GGDEF)-like protein/PAS domain S-box-containing protein
VEAAPPRGRRALVPPIAVALLCAGYAAGAALDWGTPRLALIMGDFGLAGAAGAACLSCLWQSRVVPGRDRIAWALFALSSAMVAAGNGVWGWYEVVLRQPVPRASIADLFFLMFAPPAILGLLLLAKRPDSKASWVCLGLDAWLIGGSLVTLTWSLALAKAADWDGRSTARIALSLAYPVLDIMLVSMVVALHARRTAANRSAVNTAISALALTVLCDALFTSPLLREHYHSGQILDAGWFAGSMLLAYAPLVGRRDRGAAPEPVELPRRGRFERESTGSLSALTPYLAAAVCTLGILYDVLGGRKIDRVVIFTGCTVALVLVVRQGIVLLENIRLTRELAQAESHFRSLVQGSSDVIMIAASSGVLSYVSPAARGVYGRDSQEMVGTELAAHIHPEDLGRVLHEVRRFLAASPGDEPAMRIECRIRSGDGGWLNVESSVNRYQGGLLFNSRDVTERVRLQAQLQHNASHDPLTDLPNRALFTERVGQALSGRRAGDGDAAVLYIDLDGFKAVNDTVGHQAGDELLVQAARRLQEAVRSGDTAARLGGDEFAALIVGGTGEGQARERRIREIAERLRLTLSEPYVVTGGTHVRVAASIGIAFATPTSTSAELMRNADLAMYRAKSAGKNRVMVYQPQMQAEPAHRPAVVSRVRNALRGGEFTLLHQPVVDLRTGAVEAVYAHPRWRSEQGALFTPAEFLRFADGPPAPAGAERRTARPQPPPAFGAAPEAASGTAPGHEGPGGPDGPGRPGNLGGPEASDGARGRARAEVLRWTLEEAARLAAHRYRLGHRVPVTVRLPVRRLLGRDLPAKRVESLLLRHELPAGALLLEVSDHDPLVPVEELERRLVALRRAGARIVLGGLGTGYAAMVALRRLPVDAVSLERALTEAVADSPRLRKITAGVARIALDLGLPVVADGVDQADQAVALRELGCGQARGVVFDGPLEDTRLPGVLALGYPVPYPPGLAVVSAGGALPVRKGGSCGPDPLISPPLAAPDQLIRPPLRSHNETSVPPA